MKVPSIEFLLFNILGIVLSNTGYTKSLIVMLCIYSVVVLFCDTKNMFLYFVAMMFGIVGSFLAIHIKNDNSFIKFIGNKVKIEANVLSDGVKKKDLYYYDIETRSIRFKGDNYNIKKKLILKTSKVLEDINYREVSFVGEVKIPKEARNFFGFNYKRYLDSRKIEGTVFSDNIKIGKRIKKSVLLNIGDSLRKRIITTIDDLLDKREASLLKCVLIGDANCLEDDFGFRDLGLAHMLSVSGVNVLYIIMIAKFLLRKVNVARKLINPILIVMLGFYALVVGFTPSLIRSVVMTVLSLMGEILFYKSNSLSNLAIAALIILLMNPFLLYSVGFQFSFVATLFIILFVDRVKKVLEIWSFFNVENLAISIVVSLGILPLEMYHFNKISICSVIVNIIVSPIHSMIIFIGIIMTVVGSISTILAKPIAIFLEIIIKFLFILSDGIFKVFNLNVNAVYIGLVGIVVYYSVFGIIYIWKKWDRGRIFFIKYRNIFIVLTTILIITSWSVPKKLKVNFMDVGQGDCAIIQTIHNKNILIDGGEEIDLSDIIRNDVNKIDIMIATHGHMDHIGGLLNILENMKVDKLIVPDTQYIGELDKLRIDANKTKLYRCKVRDSIYIDEYTKMEFLGPNKNSNLCGENDNSLVVRLKHKGVNFLFTGDITNICEKDMIDNNLDFRAHVLKIAHHGSMYSTSDEFLNKVNPSLAIISVGENNKFDHPSHEVLEKLSRKNIRVLRTDKNGQVQIVIDGERIRVRSKFL